MTAYFDNKDKELRQLRDAIEMLERDPDHVLVAELTERGQGSLLGNANRIFTAIDDWEHTLVYDVTLCAQQPGFPEDLREAAYKLMLRHGVATLPVNHGGRTDIESVDDHLRSLATLSHHLHTVFHALAGQNIDRFSDDPRAPMRCIFSDGEEIRERMVAQMKVEQAIAAAATTKREPEKDQE